MNRNQKLIDALAELAAFLKANPQLEDVRATMPMYCHHHGDCEEQQDEFRRLYDGEEINDTGDRFHFQKRFGSMAIEFSFEKRAIGREVQSTAYEVDPELLAEAEGTAR